MTEFTLQEDTSRLMSTWKPQEDPKTQKKLAKEKAEKNVNMVFDATVIGTLCKTTGYKGADVWGFSPRFRVVDKNGVPNLEEMENSGMQLTNHSVLRGKLDGDGTPANSGFNVGDMVQITFKGSRPTQADPTKTYYDYSVQGITLKDAPTPAASTISGMEMGDDVDDAVFGD